MLFFHVGLHKTGTTFLQQAVFPKWKDVEYILWPNLEIFLRLRPDRTYLVSREGLSGQNWAHHAERDASLRRLAEIFPDARTLISFRKHSGYIASSYKQYLQRGGTMQFAEYFDIHDDRGMMKREDFLYRNKIASLVTHFGRRPFVFFHHEILGSMQQLLADMQRFVGGRAPQVDEIKVKRYNKGVGYYPAKLLRKLNHYARSDFNPSGRYDLNSPLLQKLRMTPKAICQHWLAFLPDRKLISEQLTAEIDEFYADDWNFVTEYARERSARAGTVESSLHGEPGHQRQLA